MEDLIAKLYREYSAECVATGFGALVKAPHDTQTIVTEFAEWLQIKAADLPDANATVEAGY